MADGGYIREIGSGQSQAELLVPTMHCAGCISKIERELGKNTDITKARANLSTKRVTVQFASGALSIEALLERMKSIGFEASPFEPMIAGIDNKRLRSLFVALAVAGFAWANIMLLSVSVWDGSEMDVGTMGLFHWVSALIAGVGILFAGQPFFKSAYSALRVGQVNMDVPISLAVLLSYGSSIFEVIHGGKHVFFDAGVMLLFFLLIGRVLDERMRGKASSAAQNLIALQAVPATVVARDGSQKTIPADQVQVGERVLVATGMRIPVDGTVVKGKSSIDMGLVTGESIPEVAEKGTAVYAGTLNITAPLTIETTGRGRDTLLGEIINLMETAEQGRSKYVRLADRLARLYAPAVHILAALAFAGWWAYSGDAYLGVLRAVAVLIITCPCALGLAVPVVQVVAAGLLMKDGVLLKSGDALEKLADVDTVVFDKTGTLTLGEMALVGTPNLNDDDYHLAASLAMTSRHPLAQGLARAYRKTSDTPFIMFDDVTDRPGEGLEVEHGGKRVRIGSRSFTGAPLDAETYGPELWFQKGSAAPVQLTFEDSLRDDAHDVISWMRRAGYDVHLISGDRAETVERVAGDLGITNYRGGVTPEGKITFLTRLKESGCNVLMVGDGLNDAPALRAAHVSFSPASGADITQSASDAVFQGKSLCPVVKALVYARIARRRVRENFGLAIGYNIIAVPLALLGFVTPLVAAIAMSASSIIVTLNALRMRFKVAMQTEKVLL